MPTHIESVLLLTLGKKDKKNIFNSFFFLTNKRNIIEGDVKESTLRTNARAAPAQDGRREGSMLRESPSSLVVSNFCTALFF